MVYYIDGKAYCDNCCLSCDDDKKTCEAWKERRRVIRRITYQAKKAKEGG